MNSIQESILDQFYAWEQLGRGQLPPCDYSTPPEPPFVEFQGYHLPSRAVFDDGRKETFLSRLFGGSAREEEPAEETALDYAEVTLAGLERSDIVEIHVGLSPTSEPKGETFGQFLQHLDSCHEPISIELFGTSKEIRFQISTAENDVQLVIDHLTAYFPEAEFTQAEGTLEKAWEKANPSECAIFEFALEAPFLDPLPHVAIDPYVALVGAMGDLTADEFVLFQTLVQPRRDTVGSRAWKLAMSSEPAGSIFKERPKLCELARRKISERLYGVVVRLLCAGRNSESVATNLQKAASALRVFSQPNHNQASAAFERWLPVARAHRGRVRQRNETRWNAPQPDGTPRSRPPAVKDWCSSPKFRRDSRRTKPAPDTLSRGPQGRGLFLGNNVHRGDSERVYLTAEQRVRHSHIIGAPGTGKSNLLFNLIRDDIERGEGVAVLDPHGDLVKSDSQGDARTSH